MRVVILTLDHHVAGAVERAREALREELPGLRLSLRAAASFGDPAELDACLRDIAEADIVFANMLFLDEHIRAVRPALEARRDHCDAMVCAMSAGEVMRLTRMGRFSMDGTGAAAKLLKKLRGKRTPGKDGGSGQLAMLRRLPKLLKLVPGKAQDLRAYLLTLSYWLSGSSDNLADLVRMLVTRYASGERAHLRGALDPAPPRQYPETGLYHPRVEGRVCEDVGALPTLPDALGTVGLLVMRSYVLAGDTAHYDAVIDALEARGLNVRPAFASGLDARPAIDAFFTGPSGAVEVDALLSLTGFSLVGGPAFHDASAAEEVLARLDVPYLGAQPLELQAVEQWEAGTAGLTPIEATIMVSIPELDGATGPIVFGGRRGGAQRMQGMPDRVARLTDRVQRLVRLRRTPRRDRRLAIVLFNFPPNAGATGTAAFLSVFESLHRTLVALAAEGWRVDVPESVDALREAVLGGNAARHGTDANVVAKIDVEDHIRHQPHLEEIEATWGAAPGAHLTDGRDLFVLGARFGNVLVGVQPGFGTEGDPMKLLFARDFAPTHAFAAFYRYLREGFEADAVLHFGTHGALEFMPGKQVGLGPACWPDRLIADLPNVYLYASNNPSEGALAKRRAAATLVSHLTPPIARAGLYRGLRELRESLDRLRSRAPGDPEIARLAPAVQAQAAALELCDAAPRWVDPERGVDDLVAALSELEQTLIPHGLHVLGGGMSAEARLELLRALAEDLPEPALQAIIDGAAPAEACAAAKLPRASRARVSEVHALHAQLLEDHELPAIVRALDGRFIRPAPGGDLLRNPAVLPTGRNLHGFDPFGLPTTHAAREGALQAERLLARHVEAGEPPPRSVAIVLWGADNLKSGGEPIGQALALLGARPRLDSYGRLAGAELVPLPELGRPRVDVLITLSGIFRDLLPLQTRMLAEAALLAASADEPEAMNPIRAHARAYRMKHGVDLETAALRVFSNAEGAYGANVNQLVDAGTWTDEGELADAYERRKCFAYGAAGGSAPQEALLTSLLGGVELAYQNLESVELGVTTIDHYFDTLGGISRASARAKGGAPAPVYIGDLTQGEGKVRTLEEQVALESRTRSLNPKWAEEMLKHGAEGVRQIEAQVSNTLGWSATTAQVQPWVYRELTRTYVLDDAMRERLAALNPKASMKLANRLLEASERAYWEPDEDTRAALEAAGDALEDQLEGIGARVA